MTNPPSVTRSFRCNMCLAQWSLTVLYAGDPSRWRRAERGPWIICPNCESSAVMHGEGMPEPEPTTMWK
jgi:hypothetical protein